MNADPQLRERLDRATREMRFDPDAGLERVRTGAARRGRSRRIGALALAAAIGIVAVILVWRLPLRDGGTRPGQATPAGRIALDRRGADETTDAVAFDLDSGAIIDLAAASDGERGAVWSPDGTRLAYILDEPDGSSAIVVARADGSDPVRIAEHQDTGLVGPDLLNVTWSPDGERIAYTGRAPGHGRTVLIVAADGSGEPTVLDGLWGDVAWSPDGERLLLAGLAQEGAAADLYTVRPDGTDLVQLTDDEAGEHDPSWSPDGEAIAFAAGSGDQQDIFVMDADGSNARVLTDQEGIDVFPVWSPDGHWIAFASDRDATEAQRAANRSGESLWSGHGVYVMRPDGSDVRLILPGGVGGLFPSAWAS